ncbi:MAG: tonB-system energizer ExbB [Rhodoblastus sp.]
MKPRWLFAAFVLSGAALLAASGAGAQDTIPLTVKGGALPHDLSPWSMFMSADVVVKAVMVGLAIASVATWTIFFAKTFEISRARRRLSQGLARIADASSVADARALAAEAAPVLTALLDAAAQEERLSVSAGAHGRTLERAASRFAEIVRGEQRAVRAGMGALATIGSTAPFVGLFGTVWGIMNSFIGISKSQTTNLAVVAPGIAEALLATAIGLVAAIPAVIVYNHFTRKTAGYLDIVGQASGAATRLLSRDLDRGGQRAFLRAAE